MSAWNGVSVRSGCPPSTDTPLVDGALPPLEEEAAADRPGGADATADVQSTSPARAGMIPVRQMALRDEQQVAATVAAWQGPGSRGERWEASG